MGSDEAEPTGDSSPDRHDVAIVGGGPAGSAAAVFTARYGLDTVVFDSGPSSLRRCAFLENYLGFPAGIDIETFHDLAHAQVREAGATIQEERVDTVDHAEGSVTHANDSAGFELTLADGTVHCADRVLAATRSGGQYLRPLDGDAMFETHEYDGEVHEHFDGDYSDADGRTPVDGLYVASPSGERDVQAIVAAGQGAHVARRLLADWRAAEGYPEGLDEVYDWLRPDSEFAGDWGGRDRWRQWFESRLPESADPDDEHLRDLRETYVDQALATRRSPEEIDQVSDDAIEELVATLGSDRVLEAIPEDRLREHLADEQAATGGSVDG